MTRQQLLDALPCFVCGDLPPELMELVQAAVDADPELAEQVQKLALSRLDCDELMARKAPAALSWANADAPLAPSVTSPGAEPPHTRSRLPVWLLLAVGLVLVLLPLVEGVLPQRMPTLGAEAVTVAREVYADSPEDLAGWVATSSPEILNAAFLAAGLEGVAASVPDMSGAGFTLVGGVASEEGSLLVWEDAEGRRVHCHMLADTPLHERPTRTLASPTGTGPPLELYGEDVVIYRQQGIICVLVSRIGAEPLLAFARRGAWGGGA